MTDDLVQSHINRWMSRPFEWGVSDCFLVIADYLQDITGIDCASHYRGCYSSARSCHRLTGVLRSPVAVFSDGVARLDLIETISPRRGDVGLIKVNRQIVGGLFLGSRWACKSDSGVAIGQPEEIIKMWKVV